MHQVPVDAFYYRSVVQMYKSKALKILLFCSGQAAITQSLFLRKYFLIEQH